MFWARIMKEHSLFLQAGFLPAGECYKREADWYRRRWEDFLRRAVRISNGFLDEEILCSGEAVTEFTEKAEKQTSCLTGIRIDSSITEAECLLRGGCSGETDCRMVSMVRRLNSEALQLISGLIELKKNILEAVESCCLFTVNYPLLIRHIIREAELYEATIRELNETGYLSSACQKTMETFWNRIMMEHALFTRGLLDPSEETLIQTADGFAKDYKKLLEEAKKQECRTMDELTRETVEETVKYRDFKAAGAKGITECEISSLILPLLADHVLREANHYLRILGSEWER